MPNREEAYLLGGEIQIDDAYLGGKLLGGKADRGLEDQGPQRRGRLLEQNTMGLEISAPHGNRAIAN